MTILEQKFTEMVKAFRKKLEGLPPELKSHNVNTAESMQSPCQIHVLSCNEYNLHLIIKTHDPEYGDIVKETIISHDKFDDDITNFLEQPIWKKLAQNSDSSSYDYLVSYLVRFGVVIRDRNIDRQSTLTSFTGDGNLSTWELFTDIANFDLKEKAVNYADWYAKELYKSLESRDTNTQAPIPLPTTVQHQGFGAYFYPFIIIGDFKRTFKGQLTGSDYNQFDEFIYDGKFANMRLAVTKIGLIGVEIDNPVLANRIINTVFGTASLSGLQVHANGINEIAGVSMKERAFVYSWQNSTLRTLMFDYGTRFARLHLSKIPIPVDAIHEIIRTAERIWTEGKFVTELELFLQSQTHFYNRDFLQSFNTSWLVIERYLRHKFGNKTNALTGGIKKHIEKLDISRIMDILRTDGDITDDEFKKYDTLRDRRNVIFHGREPPSLDESKECLDVTMDIVSKETGISKKFDFDSIGHMYI